MKIPTNIIAVAAGVVILAIATWFAFQTPSAPPIPAGDASSTPATTTTPVPSSSGTENQPAGTGHNRSVPATAAITILAPSSSSQWTIGQQNTISWNKPAGVTGQLYLVNAVTGAIVGWIQQNIAPGQTYFPWNTRDLFVSATDPQSKDILPGTYIIVLSAASSSRTLHASSAPFLIIAASSTLSER